MVDDKKSCADDKEEEDEVKVLYFRPQGQAPSVTSSRGNMETVISLPGLARDQDAGGVEIETTRPGTKSSGKGSKGVDQETNSNHLRTSECSRCKNAGSLSGGCAGCGKAGNNLKHCLAHCTSYMMENVAGRWLPRASAA